MILNKKSEKSVKTYIFYIFSCLVFFILSYQKVYALSMGLYTEKSPYKGVDWLSDPIPLLSFDSKYLYIDSLTVGVYLYKNNNSNISIALNYLPLNFSIDDTNNSSMKKINDRKSTVLSGINYNLFGKYGSFNTSIYYDLLDRSDTLKINVSYAYTINILSNVYFTPELGITWYNSSHNKYYYGINKEESIKSGFAEYNPKGSFMPYTGLTVGYIFAKHIKIMASIQYRILSNEISNSPIVGRTNSTTFFTGLIYIF